MRSETLRVISGSNLSLSSKTGNSANNGNSTITASSGSSSTGYGIDSDRRARSKSSTHVPYRNSKNALNAGVKRTKSSSSAHAYDSDTSYGEICRSSSGLSLSHSHGMSFDIDESDYGENCSHSSGSSLILGPSPHPQPSLPPMAHSVKSKAETKTYVPPLLPPRVNASSPFASPSPSLPYSPSTPSSSSLCASEHGQTTSIASPSCQFSFSPCFHSSSSSAFTSSHFSPASASLIVNSGSKDDKRRAYFRKCVTLYQHFTATWRCIFCFIFLSCLTMISHQTSV